MKNIRVWLVIMGCVINCTLYPLTIQNISDIPTDKLRISLFKIVNVDGSAKPLSPFQFMQFNKGDCLTIPNKLFFGVGALKMVVYSPDRDNDGYQEMLVQSNIASNAGYLLLTNFRNKSLELWGGADPNTCMVK